MIKALIARDMQMQKVISAYYELDREQSHIFSRETRARVRFVVVNNSATAFAM